MLVLKKICIEATQCDQKIEKKNRQVFGKSSQESSQKQTTKNHM
jgi:hypothetical protein